MSSALDAPDPTDPADNDAGEETTQDHEAAGEAQGGLVGAGAAQGFTDAVDRRLARRAPEDPSPGSSAAEGEGRPDLEEQEDSPVRVDNPE
ncbi:UNVERIFIED_CONTAM: hypothetical protein RF653_17150 [Kocuria sp. CPCC 205316]|uniref:hypothetical protein n=1 Tax=Kocuria TaxID=57493 RepID=UPI0036DD5EE5